MRTVTAGDYSVIVWGLPRVVTGVQIKAHFERLLDRTFAKGPEADLEAALGGHRGDPGPFTGVAEVFLARADSRVLTKFKTRGNLIREKVSLEAAAMADGLTPPQKSRLEAKNDKVLKRIERLDQQIDGFDKTGRLNPVVCAFVIFNSQASKLDVLKKYVVGGGNGGFLGLVPPPHECLFEGKRRLQVSLAPEPSNIVWENLEATLWERSLRKLVASLANIVIILISFFLIVWGKSVQTAMQDNRGSCSEVGYAAQCNANLRWGAATPYGCPAGAAECTLDEAWGGVGGLGMTSVTPLSVDVTSRGDRGVPVVLAAARCRRKDDGGIYEPYNLTMACWGEAKITKEQWLSLASAQFAPGFANASGWASPHPLPPFCPWCCRRPLNRLNRFALGAVTGLFPHPPSLYTSLRVGASFRECECFASPVLSRRFLLTPRFHVLLRRVVPSRSGASNAFAGPSRPPPRLCGTPHGTSSAFKPRSDLLRVKRCAPPRLDHTACLCTYRLPP